MLLTNSKPKTQNPQQHKQHKTSRHNAAARRPSPLRSPLLHLFPSLTMAAFEHFKDMYDVALKPRLLNTIIREHLPSADHPFSNPYELSKVVSLIKTHSLLSDSVTESLDPKLIKALKSSFTSWVDRLLLLISSHEVNFITFHYYTFWIFNIHASVTGFYFSQRIAYKLAS